MWSLAGASTVPYLTGFRDGGCCYGSGFWDLVASVAADPDSRCCVVALLVEDTEATWRTWTCTFRAVLRNFSCSIRNHGSAVETPAKAIPNAQC